MTRYATLKEYNIGYDEISKEFFITSKTDGRPMIGGFNKAADAIDFADKRVVQIGKRL